MVRFPAVAGSCERGVRRLLRNSVNHLARHILTHTGKSGEHYIAGSRSEWIAMGFGALGAGGITAFTALFKYSLAAMGCLARLWIGVAQSLNYSTSFVLMQFLGWRLASKMPSMTAAALCAALQKDDGMQSEVRLVAAITRAQTIVTLGNLLGAIPLAILIDGLISGVPAIRFSPMKLPSTAWNPCIPFDRSPSPLERLPDASSGCRACVPDGPRTGWC